MRGRQKFTTYKKKVDRERKGKNGPIILKDFFKAYEKSTLFPLGHLIIPISFCAEGRAGSKGKTIASFAFTPGGTSALP